MEVECKIEILEVKTGEIAILEKRKYLTNLDLTDEGYVNCFMWEDGNYSCDCNRQLFFRESKNLESEDIDCGNSNYKIKITRTDTNETVYDEFGNG